MDLIDGFELITKAYEKQDEDKAFQLYTSVYPMMDEKTYIPFEEFYKPQRKTEEKPVVEILEEVRTTLNSYKGRWAA